MDAAHFDTLTRSLSTAGSRRRALLAIVGGTLGLLDVSTVQDVAAKNCKKIKNKQKRKKCLAKAKSCTPACDGKECGDNGCGETCGGCAGGTCGSNGRCVCPAGTSCSPGVCCPHGQACRFGSCEACQLGSSPCTAQACGRSGGPLPCACATSIENVAHCVAPTTPGPLHCSPCLTDEDCDEELGVPAGSAVCIEAQCLCDETFLGRACAPKCTGA